MELIVKNNFVYKRSSVGGAVIDSAHDSIYHTELSYDGANVTVNFKDYLGTAHPYNGPVSFLIDGDVDTSFDTSAAGGVATMAFSAVTGTYRIATQMQDMRNGEVIINA